MGAPGLSTSASVPTAFEANRTALHSILDWSFNDDSGEHARFYEQADGPGWMARLLPLRDELLRGDTRPLYLGWLARLGNGELRDSDREPPLPNGLQTLTPAQASLAEFMMLDPDWLAAAAEASPPLPAHVDDERFEPWLLELTAAEMRDALRQLLRGNAQETERGLRTRFLSWDRTHNPGRTEPVVRRTVAEIDARRAMLPVPFEYVANGQHVTLQRCAVLPNVAATWIRWSSTKARHGSASTPPCSAGPATHTVRRFNFSRILQRPMHASKTMPHFAEASFA